MKKQNAIEKKSDFSSAGPSSLILFLETSWPGEMAHDVRAAFSRLKVLASTCKGESHKKVTTKKPERIELLDLIKEMLAKHDKIFLSKQIRYHVSTSPDLPAALVNRECITNCLSELLGHISLNSPRGGRVSIISSKIGLRSGVGVQMEFHANDNLLTKENFKEMLSNIYHLNDKLPELAALAKCRKYLIQQGGQLIIERLPTNRISYRLLMPADEGKKQTAKECVDSYRFDITIANFNMVRKHYGINKSKSLIVQIENFVKTLVRHPIDLVISDDQSGIVSAIYESQLGHANTVSNRISSRLPKEEFRVGKRPVKLSFGYKLTHLPAKH